MLMTRDVQAGASVRSTLERVGPRHEAGPKDMDPSSSSSPEEQEAYREGGRPCCIKPCMATEPAHGGGRLPLRLPLRAGCRASASSNFFLTDLRKHSRTQDVAVASSLSKACLATSRNSGFVQRGVFFRSFSAMIEVFSSFPSPGRQTRVYPPTMTLCAEGFTRGSLGPLEWPNGPEV